MFITVDDATLFTTAFGSPDAPPILGIGGWIGSWELWAPPFARLSAGWYTIAYDHRGSGATLASIDSITFDRMVDDIFAVMDAYGVERCTLAAESAGVSIAVGAALRRPERVAALVLVDGMVRGSTAGEEAPFLIGLRTDYEATLDAFVELCVPEPGSEPIKRWGRQILDRASPEAAIALYRIANSVDFGSELGGVHQPTLILHGGADEVVPVEEARWLAGVLPEATLTVLPGAGHVPTLTRPEEVAREIDAFLKGL